MKNDPFCLIEKKTLVRTEHNRLFLRPVQPPSHITYINPLPKKIRMAEVSSWQETHFFKRTYRKGSKKRQKWPNFFVFAPVFQGFRKLGSDCFGQKKKLLRLERFFLGCRKKTKLFRSRNERPNPQTEQFSERFGSGGRRALGEVRRRWTGDKKLCRVVQLAAAGTEEVRNSLQEQNGLSCGKETEKCQEGAS